MLSGTASRWWTGTGGRARPVSLLLAATLVAASVAGCGGAPQSSQSRPPAASQAQQTAAPPAPASPSSASQALQTFRVTYPPSIAVMAPMWISMADGAFTRRGVNFSAEAVNPQSALASVIGGHSDATILSAAGLITADASHAGLVMVASLSQRAIFSLFAAKGIHSAQQLVGQPFGSGNVGSPVEYGALLALHQIGLKESQVKIIRFNSAAVMDQALVGGRLKAAIAQPPQNFLLQSEGYPQLAGPPTVPFQAIGLIVKQSRLAALKPVLLKVLAALRSGMLRYANDKPYAIQVMHKYFPAESPTILAKSYGFYAKLSKAFTPNLLVSRQGLLASKAFLARSESRVAPVKISTTYDNALASQVDKAAG